MNVVTFACAISKQWKKAFEVSLKKRDELDKAKQMLTINNLSIGAETGLRETVKSLESDLEDLQTKVGIIEVKLQEDTLKDAVPGFRCAVCEGIIQGEKDPGVYVHLDCLGRLK